MNRLDMPDINEGSRLPKETKIKIAVGVMLSLCLLFLGFRAMRQIPKIELSTQIEETVPEEVVIDIDNLNMAKSSWRNAAWCAVDKETVTSIHIVDSYTGAADATWLVDELIFMQSPEGAVYISVGPGLHMLGSMRGAFAGFINATEITGLHLLETSAVTDMSYLFSESKFSEIDISMWDTSSVTNFSYMVYQTENLETIHMDNMDLSQVVDISYMFAYSTVLTDIHWENVDTSHILSMEGLFDGVGSSSSKGKTVLHGKIDTASCTNLSYMFRRARMEDLTSIVQDFNTTAATNMQGMFYHALNLFELDLSSWDVSNVVNMTEMFYDITFLKHLNVDGWTPNSLIYADKMFANCYNLRSFSGWEKTPNIKSTTAMFANCFEMQSIDVTCFDGATIENADDMFFCMQYVTTIYSNGFTVVNEAPEMFMYCVGLTTPSPYDEHKVSEEMATTTGYFTPKK